MSTIDIHNDKFVSMQFITELTGLSDKWFYKLAQEGKFPKPVKFGRSSRWIEREVKEWLEERIKLSRADAVVIFDEETE
ncbi:AlpA family phage regulatory protein [Enterobacter hormaechei]|uniref:helix-turn-helix transcriptional regulator n=1 Tax=Enterobacter hormaechei TaxID=158836 RepID=UPI00389F972A|nr:AlpA family phage regulatory protein [Enterobacter hormaechei]HCA7858582.1 AlpA family phage regulatory protein [Enterobacter hormaechei]